MVTACRVDMSANGFERNREGEGENAKAAASLPSLTAQQVGDDPVRGDHAG